ncbi:MAG TPA: histidine phosphatase family protein [Thermoanaerobaculia bacterium]|nr:histidine phosphatase family protein [Thermoanaerobaculia bacterium]
MKRDLLLLRHAKSDWDAGAGSDHDRPLAPRGVAAAQRIGEWLAASGSSPDLVVASTAVRATETARLVLRAGRWDPPLRVERAFYVADVESMLEQVRLLDDACGCVLLVGHEPTWSRLASALIGGGAVRMPTAAVAGVQLELDSWRGVEAGSGTLRFLVTPRLLAG